MYIFLGCRYLNFTNRQTGELLQGYQLFFYRESENGIGYEPIKVFLSPERFNTLFGSDMNYFKPFLLKQCYPQFGYKGRFEGMRFDDKK